CLRNSSFMFRVLCFLKSKYPRSQSVRLPGSIPAHRHQSVQMMPSTQWTFRSSNRKPVLRLRSLRPALPRRRCSNERLDTPIHTRRRCSTGLFRKRRELESLYQDTHIRCPSWLFIRCRVHHLGILQVGFQQDEGADVDRLDTEVSCERLQTGNTLAYNHRLFLEESF